MSEPTAQRVAALRVSAYGNVVVFDMTFVTALFGSNFESVVVTWDMDLAQPEWNQDCNDWNAEMDIWESTKDAVEAGAIELADDIDALASALESSVASLETAAGCVNTTGKKLCIDFFIEGIFLNGFGLGDARGFDPNADYSQSRVQLYLDPDTEAWEVKWGCTKLIVPGVPVGSSWQIHAVCDSATVFNPAEHVQRTPPDPEGWRTVTVKFGNNACRWRWLPICPEPIDATIWFRPNPAAQGGYEVSFYRDSYPSMGVYSRNSSNTAWEVVKEDDQKIRGSINALRALAGEMRHGGNNYPPPGGQPDGCFRQ